MTDCLFYNPNLENYLLMICGGIKKVWVVVCDWRNAWRVRPRI